MVCLQCNTIQCNTIQCNTIQCNTIQYNIIQYNTIQYNTIQYNTIQYNTIQYNTIQYIIWLQGRRGSSRTGYIINVLGPRTGYALGFSTPEQGGKFKMPVPHTLLIKVEFPPPPGFICVPSHLLRIGSKSLIG